LSGETSQSLDRGLRTLSLLSTAADGYTVTELAAALDTSRPAVYRLVTALGRHGLAHRAADGRIRLGLAVLQLARGVQPLLRQAALPILRDLAEDVGATAHLTVAESESALAVAVVEPSWTSVHVAYRVGSRHRLDRGAAGLAILAARDGSRASSWLVTEGELQPGARGIAAAVAGPGPWLIGIEASVGVVSLTDLDASIVGPRVVRAAADLARALVPDLDSFCE
jgi:DNA-binding IclR family transcriptional regulator